jgi:hypothetical protein
MGEEEKVRQGKDFVIKSVMHDREKGSYSYIDSSLSLLLVCMYVCGFPLLEILTEEEGSLLSNYDYYFSTRLFSACLPNIPSLSHRAEMDLTL